MKLWKAILKVLAVAPRPLTPLLIAGSAAKFLGEVPTIADVLATLRDLEARGDVKGTLRDAEEEEALRTAWLSTEQGRLRIA